MPWPIPDDVTLSPEAVKAHVRDLIALELEPFVGIELTPVVEYDIACTLARVFMEVGVDQEYDPCLHVTAGELRATGYKLSSRIPDCAWVPRRSFKIEGIDHDGDCSVVRWGPTEPFRWWELRFEVEP